MISHLKNCKAAGPDGFGASHVKYMINKFQWFPQYLADLYNILIEFPERVSELDAMYEFRSVFIPKNSINP